MVTETLAANKFLNSRQLLQSSLRRAPGPHDVRQHVSAVQWLLSQASLPGQLMVDDSSSLISIPKIPLAMAELLVSAGARITYQQLVAAARSQVEGVLVWVTAQQQLRSPNDLPLAVEAVCRAGVSGNRRTLAQIGFPGVLEDLTLDQLVDLLYITLNMLSGGCIPIIQSFVRQIVRALAGRHLDSDRAMQLCKNVMQICSTRAVRMDITDRCISSVLELQKFTDLPTPAVHDLLLQALRQGVPAARWHEMCERCQAVHFDTAQSQAILAAAVKATVQHESKQTLHFTYLKACSKLAGVRSDNVHGDFAGKLLRTAVAAVSNGNGDCRGTKLQELLTALPGAVVNAVSREVIARVIQTVVHDCSMLGILCQLPAAGEVCPAAVFQALKAAIRVGNAKSVSRLLELERAAGISAAEVAELINLAVAQDNDTLGFLCRLPAANEVHPAAVFQALNAAIGVGNADSMYFLVELEGAAGINAAEVAELIHSALVSKQQQDTAPQASASKVSEAGLPPLPSQLLLDSRLVWFLCQLKEARNIPVARLAGLLEMAVQHGDSLDVQALTLLPEARELDHVFVQLLAERARLCGTVHKEHALTRLQAGFL